jgi:hypothetical protein
MVLLIFNADSADRADYHGSFQIRADPPDPLIRVSEKGRGSDLDPDSPVI